MRGSRCIVTFGVLLVKKFVEQYISITLGEGVLSAVYSVNPHYINAWQRYYN